MCGISGIITFNENLDPKKLKLSLNEMINKISHRGPDGEGFWSGKNVYLAHKRLAIIDLTSNARQPMRSSCGRYIINFNGEIYNYVELKKKIKINRL